MKKKYLIFFGMLLANVTAIGYCNYKLELPDKNFYFGKDEGLTTRFGVTILMSMLFFSLMTKNNKVIFLLYGFFVGIFTMILSYLLIGMFTRLDDVFYQIIATVFYMFIFMAIENWYKSKTSNTQ